MRKNNLKNTKPFHSLKIMGENIKDLIVCEERAQSIN